MSGISDDIIRAVTLAGFDVYMRDPARDTWLIFVDGDRLGYLQASGHRGLSLSTVHVPNTVTGTGYGIADGLSVPDLTRAALSSAFAHSPDWADNRARASVRKWVNLEAFRAANRFNGEYRLIAKGAAT